VADRSQVDQTIEPEGPVRLPASIVDSSHDAILSTSLRYRRLFETAKDGILILDAADGTVLDVNPSLSKLLANSPGDLVGKPLWDVGLFRDRPSAEGVLRQVRERGECRYEGMMLEAGGQRRDVEIVASLYRETRDCVIQCNVRDVTERRRLERQTREQAAALSDLQRRKDEFLAMLSHELRNPLAPLSNAVQVLRLEHGSESPVEEQARTIIERQVAQLSHLVDDLLEVSRITTGRIQLHCEELALAPIVERAVTTARLLVDQRRQHLTVSLPPHPMWLDGDADRVEQILDNLLDNAVKYTPSGGRVRLRLVAPASDGGPERWALLEVEDSGIGIEPRHQERIFERFYRVDKARSRELGGTGLGLSIVKHLALAHGGRVSLESTPGRGSTFRVHLPSPSPAA
jgi:PAS domain S-box-containing protein